MNSIWTVLLIILLVLVGLRFLPLIFALGFGILRFLLPLVIIGFTIYGIFKFMENRRK